ncbi:MAG: Na+/H+ antiporter subunit E [Dehalococcoidia bacterium]
MITTKNLSHCGLTFLLLFGFWILLSGRRDAMHLGLGLVCSLLVALFSHDLLITSNLDIRSRLRIFIRFIPFLGWLVFQIIIANIDVARRVIDPRMPLSPGIIKLSSRLKGDMALTTLANSITLTPGTMTLDVVGSDFYIHCLAVEDAEKSLDIEGEFERQVERLWGEGFKVPGSRFSGSPPSPTVNREP